MSYKFDNFPPTQQEILLMFTSTEMLVKSGYNKDRIKWDRTGISNTIYLRYGYWKEITIPPLLQGILKIDSYEDQDCGMMYKYNLKSE